jgi:hypothetical protein
MQRLGVMLDTSSNKASFIEKVIIGIVTDELSKNLLELVFISISGTLTSIRLM